MSFNGDLLKYSNDNAYIVEQTAYTKELLSTVSGKNNSFILSFVEIVSSYHVQTNPVLLISPWIKTFISSITNQFNEVCELVICKADPFCMKGMWKRPLVIMRRVDVTV